MLDGYPPRVRYAKDFKMENSQEQFRTNDMAMVAYLKMKGHSVQRMEWNGKTCWWFFPAISTLLDQVDEFLGDTALVNPRQYNKCLSDTKREFYDSSNNK